MVNRDVKAARDYHNGTKHPGGHLMNPQHRYDPMRNPLPFKIYPDIEPIPLSLGDQSLDMPALSAIAADIAPRAEAQVPS